MPFIMVTVLIDMVSIGLIVPVLPVLVGTFTASQAEQAFWFGAVTFAFSIANFFASPVLGALSDRFGRRPVLLLGFSALALSFFAIAVVTQLWMLILVRLFGGAMQANVSVANAYVADITAPADRARRFGLLGAMFGIGFILGPVTGGLLGAIDIHLPFFAAGGMALLNLLYGWFVLPESLPPDRRRPIDWAAAVNPVAALTQLGRLGGVGVLVAVVALTALSQFILYTCWVLYTTFKFGWGPLQNGWSLFAVGVISALVQGLLLGRLLKRFSPQRLAVAGLVSSALGYLAWGARQRRLDDVCGDLLQPARLHGGGVDPEHHLRRRRRDDAGPHDGHGELAAEPDGRASRRCSARRCSASSRTCRAATGGSARRSTSAPCCS